MSVLEGPLVVRIAGGKRARCKVSQRFG